MASYFAVERRELDDEILCNIEPGDSWLTAGPPTGKPVKKWNPKQLVVYGPAKFPRRDYDEFTDGGPFPLFSPRLQTAIEQRFPGEVQFLPLRLQRPNGTGEITGYAAANVLAIVDCVDHKRTPGMMRRGVFRPFGTVTLRDPHYRGGLFRLPDAMIIATDALKSMVEKLKFSGIQFEPIEVA